MSLKSELCHLQVALHGETNKLYACEIRRSDQFERRVGGGYNEAEFLEHPDRYISNFSNKYAPYASVIVNGNKDCYPWSMKVLLCRYLLVAADAAPDHSARRQASDLPSQHALDPRH